MKRSILLVFVSLVIFCLLPAPSQEAAEKSRQSSELARKQNNQKDIEKYKKLSERKIFPLVNQ